MAERKATKRASKRTVQSDPAPVEQRRHFFFGPLNESNVAQAVQAVRTTDGDRPVALLVPEAGVEDASSMTAEGATLHGVFELGVIASDLPVGQYAIQAERTA